MCIGLLLLYPVVFGNLPCFGSLPLLCMRLSCDNDCVCTLSMSCSMTVWTEYVC